MVEPPVIATQPIAFSNASFVMTLLGVRPFFTSSTTSRPHSSATLPFLPSSAGTIPLPIGEMPSISNAVAIVFAVNWPPHAPAPGDAWCSRSREVLVGEVTGGVRADGLEHLLDRHVLAAPAAPA